MHVFVSYASEDGYVAKRIALVLEAEGHDVFFDRTSLPPGREFDRQIRVQLEQIDLLVFLVSPDSVRDGAYTLTELGLAEARWSHPRGRVLPVIVRDTLVEGIPPYLRAVTWLDPEGDIPAEVAGAVAELESAAVDGEDARSKESVDPQIVDTLITTQRAAVRWWKALTLAVALGGGVLMGLAALWPEFAQTQTRLIGMVFGVFVATLSILPAKTLLRHRQKLQVFGILRSELASATSNNKERMESLVWESIRRLALA